MIPEEKPISVVPIIIFRDSYMTEASRAEASCSLNAAFNKEKPLSAAALEDCTTASFLAAVDQYGSWIP